MSDLLKQLAGGDRRSIGNANRVVAQMLAEPARLAEIVEGLSSGDPVIRMRCADALEKISATRPQLLQPHKHRTLGLARRAQDKEMRWHFAQMLPRLALSPSERGEAIALMFDYLADCSRIVQTCALQALSGFADGDATLRQRLPPLLQELSRTGSPAIRSRAARLLARLA